MHANWTKQAGFTLIELMVVVFIIALISGVAMVSFGQRDSRQYAAEVNRLQVMLQQAADRALMRQEIIGFQEKNEPPGYQFIAYSTESKNWVLMEEANWALHLLPPNLEIDLASQKTDFGFESDAAHILFTPEGQYTPFTAEISSPSRTRTVSGDGFSTIVFSDDKP